MLEKSYPNYPNLKDIEIRAEDLHCLMDIAPYVQIGPHAINGKLLIPWRTVSEGNEHACSRSSMRKVPAPTPAPHRHQLQPQQQQQHQQRQRQHQPHRVFGDAAVYVALTVCIAVLRRL